MLITDNVTIYPFLLHHPTDCSGSKLKTFKSTIAASMMDFSEQGPGGGTQYNNTVILESYEESCAPNTAGKGKIYPMTATCIDASTHVYMRHTYIIYNLFGF